MSVLGLHHVQVLAPPGGEPQARRFYGEVLGLREIAKPPQLARDGAWFALDDERQVHIGAFRGGDQPTRNRSHFALRVRALDDIISRLKAAGLECPDPATGEVPHWRRVRISDPFGNCVELLEITDSSEHSRR